MLFIYSIQGGSVYGFL